MATRARLDAPPAGLRLIEGGSVTSVRGFRAGAVFAGIKTPGPGKLDVAVLCSDRDARVAAMFTRNRVVGAPVLVSREHVRNGRARGIVVNAGISNVANGSQGERDAREMCALAAEVAGAAADDMLVGSTGVIGEPLPMEKIRNGIRRIELAEGAAAGHAFSRAIMTTDTHPKTMAVQFRAGRREYALGAVAKGVGMVHPDMATMFCFFATDAPVAAPLLRRAFRAAIDDSLNMISVDGDTSTSDTAAIFANGAAGGPTIAAGTPAAAAFERALRYVAVCMAQTLARDGEGAERLIEVQIDGGASIPEARAAARTVTLSPLVKAAVHGGDPNWGRVLMAVGRSGARINLDRARVRIGDIMVYRGAPLAFDAQAAGEALRLERVIIGVHLGAGVAQATAWGCDLSPEYVTINSDYTT
ncbi:MAG: bifunctional glutamate N-acetyltransferase/amino-acid acetyltransferase ArgJ [Chloroflexi bacterium]|nr:bifunctional glutamate N-acetyltransferase/amino-acid acetyltransferase ArgJ [Chloroflexota bacterium]